METRTTSFSEAVNEAAVALAAVVPVFEFDTARRYIDLFLGEEDSPPGFRRLVVDPDSVKSIRPENTLKRFSFLNGIEIAYHTYEVVNHAVEMGTVVLAANQVSLGLLILSGLILWQTLQELSTVTLSPLDGFLLRALLHSKRDEGYTEEEWIQTIRKEKDEALRINEGFGLPQLRDRTRILESLKAIELLEGKWRFSDQVVYKE